MDDSAIAEGLSSVKSLVQPDGADMELMGVDPETGTVELRLVLEGVECHECVMARPLLEEISANVMRRAVPDLVRVSVDDPREHPGYVSPDAPH